MDVRRNMRYVLSRAPLWEYSDCSQCSRGGRHGHMRGTAPLRDARTEAKQGRNKQEGGIYLHPFATIVLLRTHLLGVISSLCRYVRVNDAQVVVEVQHSTNDTSRHRLASFIRIVLLTPSPRSPCQSERTVLLSTNGISDPDLRLESDFHCRYVVARVWRGREVPCWPPPLRNNLDCQIWGFSTLRV